MSLSTNTTANQIWKNLANKEYRDSYVAAHISNTVASQIHMLREERGWTQKELAQKAGMSQSRISALEDPNYENIEVGTLKRLAAAFDVAVTVRFTAFSELATWTAELSSNKLLVPEFSNDQLPRSNAPPQIIFSELLDSAGTVIGAGAGSFTLGQSWTSTARVFTQGLGTTTLTLTGSVASATAVVEGSQFSVGVNKQSVNTPITPRTVLEVVNG